ncbi:hypothetical protein [Shewanella oncorhynchi]|uniref:hypothetical protein n=1 Tax=Shewanella oncorhynchi TaxID=2726434 RepID=UPI003D7976CA
MTIDNLYPNRLYLSLQASKNGDMDEVMSPDYLDVNNYCHVPKGFVLCRNTKGEPTAIYDEDLWDFRPYRLAASGNCRMSFSELLISGDSIENKKLVNEVKWCMFALIYFINAGAVGVLSVTTLLNYFRALMHAALFCKACGDNRMLGRLTLNELFANKMYLAYYTKSLEEQPRYKQRLNSILTHLNSIGSERLGFAVATGVDIFVKVEHNQHPIIPTRIYLELINSLTEKVEFLFAKTNNLENFINNFSDPYYGLNIKAQRKQQRSMGDMDSMESLTFEKAVFNYGLQGIFFSDDYKSNGRAQLTGALTKMQYEMKLLIHLYTGMRNDEVNRLRYNCIVEHVLDNAVIDTDNVELVPPRLINILTTTTKLTGYLSEETWYAHPIVIKAITVLRRIVRGYASMVSIEPENCPLIISVVKIFMKNHIDDSRIEVPVFKPTSKTFLNSSAFTITKDDCDVLQASDPTRNISQEQKFQVGQQWPLTTHQFRRSLAFYALSSGFVSIPTLKRQFKHSSQEMTKFYSRNFEQIKTIFGHFDSKTKKYVLPINHIAFEFQVGMPLAAVESLLHDLMDEEVELYGKSGGYFERQRDRLRNGEVLVEEFKENTTKMVLNGEVSYRKTLLGGCTNPDTCECSILGEFADCLTSECAVIKSDNIEALIKSTDRELQSYAEGSIEYLSTKSELDELIKYKKFNINHKSQ